LTAPAFRYDQQSPYSEKILRSIAKADGLDASRALQRVLYRSAKQQPQRRFHALYDKVARGDILFRAWDEVRANRGAPGADGVTIADVEASGAAAFLDDLAAALKAGTYRPAPLRRVGRVDTVACTRLGLCYCSSVGDSAAGQTWRDWARRSAMALRAG
jgi:hypothetical protein